MKGKVFLILVHHSPLTLRHLLNQLSLLNAGIYIHLDKRVNISQFKRKADPDGEFNCHWIENRVECEWGDYSIVEATINLLAVAYKNITVNMADYFLISGEDYAFIDNIREISESNSDVSSFSHWSLPYDKWWGGGMFRVNQFHLFNKKRRRGWNHNLNKYLNKFLVHATTQFQMARHYPLYKIYGGQQWMILSHRAVCYILDFLKSNPRFINAFRFAFAPDELFFHTIILNNPELKVINRPTHFVRFKGTASSPDYLGFNDISSLQLNHNYLFARKFKIDAQ